MGARGTPTLREEIDAYLAHEIDDNLARGMTPEAARAAALRKLGNRTAVEERIYDMRISRPIDVLRRDVAYGLRVLRRAPAFTIAAVLSLALGIGANTAIFQLLEAVRLRALPIDRSEELVEIRLEGRGGRMGQFTGRNSQMSNPVWEQIRDRQQALSGVFAWGDTAFNLSPTGEVRSVPGLWVSGSVFPVLRVRPSLGRLFTPDDDRRGCGAGSAVISYAFWQREYGGDRGVLGRTLTIAQRQVPIVGVTPPAFFGLEVGRSFDVALPLCAYEALIRPGPQGLDRRDFWWLTTMGRLAPGWSIERTNAYLASLSVGVVEATVPQSYRPGMATEYRELRLAATSVSAGVSELREQFQRPLVLLQSIVGLVLLVACANLANLMLARASARGREMAVRLAIGASRGRLLAQLLAESLLLAIAGAAAGVFLARWLSALLVASLGTTDDPIFLDLSANWRTLGFTAAVACATCLLFGLGPALAATRTSVNAGLRSGGGRGATTSRDRFILRRALVVSQIALSLLLVVGALLFVRSLRNVASADAGFRAEDLLIANVGLRRDDYPVASRNAMHLRLREAMAAIGGVMDVAQVRNAPFSGSFWNPRTYPDGAAQDGLIASFNQVGPGYFRTMGLR